MSKAISLTLPQSNGQPFSLESLRGSPVLLIHQSLEHAAAIKWFIDRARLWAERNPSRASHLKLVIAINLEGVPEMFRSTAMSTAGAMVPSQFVSALLFDADATAHRAFSVDKVQHAPGVDYRRLLIAALLNSQGEPVWGRFGNLTAESADALEAKLVELTDPLLST